MNTYGRIEINLLPPEMQPGPMVRYGLLINITISLLTLTFILLNLYFGYIKLDLIREDVEQLEGQAESLRYIENDYNRLASMGRQLSNYGRLVAYASLDYVEMPVVLDRMSRIIPDRVYLTRVFNVRSPDDNINMVAQLNTSDDNPQLLIDTLRNFKQDGIFSECYLPAAAFIEESLDDVLDQAGVTWAVDGPNVPQTVLAEQYEFEIHSRLPRPLQGLNLPMVVDNLDYFATLEVDSSTAAGSAGGAPAATGQPPEGVTVEEVN